MVFVFYEKPLPLILTDQVFLELLEFALAYIKENDLSFDERFLPYIKNVRDTLSKEPKKDI